MHHPHLALSLLTLGDPARLTGGYLYHVRMAEAAPRHRAALRFESFPERPFPLPAAVGPSVLRRAASAVDALLLDSIAAAFAGPWLAARDPGVPLVGVLHQAPGGMDHGWLRRAVQAPLDRLAYRRARLLIVASEWLADRLVADGFAPERLVVVPPGRDVARPHEGPLPDLRRGRRAAVLCVANWIPRKGILELLDALARLPPDAATLHLAGDTRADPRYAARVGRRVGREDLVGRVVVHGALRRDEVAALYAAADVFALPAFVEPYGTVWGEAMASGLPVVGWRTGNLPYLAPEGNEAVMVTPGDVDGLAAALRRLVEDEGYLARVGEAARERARSRPTWAEAATAFFEAVRSAVG